MEAHDELWEILKIETESIKNPVESINADDVLVGSGNRNGVVLFVGDDPALYDNEEFKVTPGSSGEFLMKLCDMSGLSPDQYYITTLSKHVSQYRDFLDGDKKKLCELLDMQIGMINPQIVVALGLEAAQALAGENIDFAKMRGKMIPWTGGKQLAVTYDVKFVMRARMDNGKKAKAATDFWNDIKNITAAVSEITAD